MGGVIHWKEQENGDEEKVLLAWNCTDQRARTNVHCSPEKLELVLISSLLNFSSTWVSVDWEKVPMAD